MRPKVGHLHERDVLFLQAALAQILAGYLPHAGGRDKKLAVLKSGERSLLQMHADERAPLQRREYAVDGAPHAPARPALLQQQGAVAGKPRRISEHPPEEVQPVALRVFFRQGMRGRQEFLRAHGPYPAAPAREPVYEPRKRRALQKGKVERPRARLERRRADAQVAKQAVAGELCAVIDNEECFHGIRSIWSSVS